MTTVKVTQKRNGSTEISIAGEFNIYSAMDIYQQHFKSISLKELVNFKLKGITEIDTAGMQMLILLFKEVEKNNAQYKIHSSNEVIDEYSKLFNIHHYFNNNDSEIMEGN
ncbi:MAG: STAS domain-containing protein [Colwelliaceae bacterium]|nr:STAS domain-containing protein [Colwelliaceae bacterium]